MLASPASAQAPSPTALAEGVHLLSGGPDGNVLVIDGEDARLVVDGWTPARAEVLLEALDALPGPPLRFVVNTHYHEDHRGLNASLAARGATVVAHAATRDYMTRTGVIQELGYTMHAASPEYLPDVVTVGDLTLHLGGRDVDLIHLPSAHTGGDLAVHVPDAGVLHTGDVFELGAWPFLDVWHGGSLGGIVAACERIADLAGEDGVVVPGHGPPSDAATVRAYREVMLGVQAKVAASLDALPEDDDEAVRAGLDAFMQSAPTAEWDERWGGSAGGRRLAAIAWLDAAELWQPAMTPPAEGEDG
jgi:cyclase